MSPSILTWFCNLMKTNRPRDKQSSLTISDVHFKNIKGVTSGKYDPVVGTIVCSSPDVCGVTPVVED